MKDGTLEKYFQKLINSVLFFLIFSNFLLLISTCIISINFIVDNNFYNLDSLGITRFSYNSFGYLCDYIQCFEKSAWILKGIMNFLMISVFWFQYLFLNNVNFQSIIISNLGKAFEVYIRLICQIFTFFSLIMMLQVYQPASKEEMINLIPSYYITTMHYFFMAMKGFSIILLLSSVFSMFSKNDLFYFNYFSKKNQFKQVDRVTFFNNGIYNYCRSPFRGGLQLLMIAQLENLDWSKALFILICMIGVLSDFYLEDIYYKKYCKDYNLYCERVQNKFFPDYRKLFKLKNN